MYLHVCCSLVNTCMTKFELACLSGWMYCICVSLFALRVSLFALDLNPASWAASVAQLAEHWTCNPVVTGSNPVRDSSVFFFSLSAFGLCLTLSCLPLHIHVQDLIMYICCKTLIGMHELLHELHGRMHPN